MILRLENNFKFNEENLKFQNLIKKQIKEVSQNKFLHGELLSDFGESYIKDNYYD